ncbi:PREDICTED: oxysterol-binding protein-related protein 10 isoform X1 [Thamnophis sirtalis]|uniref:Oxysterol-binding protein-related protein 10 n=1 Tax=Thamnophis sirtalis TaxID=35019 RepID=A0A6I9X1S7_9SAUR|nr:PREDICTED: oxysterol-binding protein-related protein 10 isoform X1 [Thamnophis sirtalis]
MEKAITAVESAGDNVSAAAANSSGGGSNSSSRSSSRPTSAGSSPSTSTSRGLSGRQAGAVAAALAARPDGGSSSSPSSAAASPGGVCGAGASGGLAAGRRTEAVLEGILSKYTNLIQGWQSRYFILDFETGILQYFVNEQNKNQKPRGILSLAGAIVSLSDEAPNMLVVYSANGEMYKLRAGDTKERQYWVTQLRSCAKYHTENNLKSTLTSRAKSLTLLPLGTANSTSLSSQKIVTQSGPPVITITHHKSPVVARKTKPQYPCQLHGVREIMAQVEGQQKNLVQGIESLPGSGPLSAFDQDFLLLKATSAAALSCLGECLHLLQQSISQVSAPQNRTLPSENILVWHGSKSNSTDILKNSALGSLTTASANLSWSVIPSVIQDETMHTTREVILVEDEVTDTEDSEEDDLGTLDDQQSVILHIISQLRLGMDLTRVVLPAFILEKRSLLEMFANFLAHPDLFLSISCGTSPEERIISFVEYYLTAFYEGRKGIVAKKPYNPIIGETFHCSWNVPKDRVKSMTANTASCGLKGKASSECYRLKFVAEQVSHHPPVSSFYCECKEKKVCVNVHVWTKSKFMGMSVGVSMVGEGILYLLEHGEEYIFTLPSAYARSILTIPWVELGGKVNIHCAKSGYSAMVTFHTKPFYGGKLHRVTAEVKHNPTNTIVCKAQGEWNGILEFTYSNGETKVIDTTKLPIIRKKIRPVSKQGPFESRHLWQHVTAALKEGDIDVATEHKLFLEERQRKEERQRATSNTLWKPKYFTKEGDGWTYFNPLWKSHC